MRRSPKEFFYRSMMRRAEDFRKLPMRRKQTTLVSANALP